MANSQRIQKVNELLKRELGKIILKELEFPRETLITITNVESSPDLREAKIWISVIPGNQISLALQVLRRDIYNLQKKLDKRLKMRPVPRIEFLKESKSEEAQKIEEILDKIREEKD
jgi:ribosome-binding factor A